MSTTLAYVFLFSSLGLGLFSQVVMKWQVSHAPPVPDRMVDRLFYIFDLLTRPWMIGALTATFVAGVCWIMTLSKLPLNVAYPYMALLYPLMIGVSYYVFDEPANGYKIAGVILISAGVVLAGRGS